MVVSAAIKASNGTALEYADESFRKDKEYLLAAMKNCGSTVMEFADDSLKKDEALVDEFRNQKLKEKLKIHDNLPENHVQRVTEEKVIRKNILNFLNK